MYFDRNATQSAAKRRGSGGMDRRSNAAWVSPQAVSAAVRSDTASRRSGNADLQPVLPVGAGIARERETSADGTAPCQREVSAPIRWPMDALATNATGPSGGARHPVQEVWLTACGGPRVSAESGEAPG